MLKNMKKLLKDKQNADKVVSYIRDGTEDTKLIENTLWNCTKRYNQT